MGFPIRMLHLGWKVFMLLLLIVYPTKAQQFSKTLYNYSQRDGLPSDAIIQTVKDGSGFTWVLTTNGLARFDGNRFESLRYNSQLPNSVPSGGVKSLEIDSENRLWLIQGNSVKVVILTMIILHMLRIFLFFIILMPDMKKKITLI